MNVCPKCGQDNRDTASFCNNCGMSLSIAPGPLPPLIIIPPSAAPASTSSPVPVSPSQGQTLALSSVLHGQYLILKELAKGGMGAVYLAQDKQLFDRLCVVKEMLPYYTTPDEKAEAEAKFEREARLLANLRHPSVPQVFDFFIEQDRYYLVMEFVDGDNLEDKQNQAGGPLPEREVIDYAGQVASVLAYIGRQTPPVIHRDIKPANIIVDKNTGQVKLVDFGIAREAAPTNAPIQSSALGTPGYSPPEQYSHNTEPRSDIFALGATMHHLLSGLDPRQAARLFDYPPLAQVTPGIAPELAVLVGRMLESDPANRPTAMEVRSTLKAIGQPLAAVASGPFAFRSGGLAHDVQELAQECDQHWDDGIYHLFNGHFEPWLQGLNRHDLAGRAETIRKRGGDPRAGLEEFLRALNPTMPLPVMRAWPLHLTLGTVEKGGQLTATIEVENIGRGYLHGDIRPLVPWVHVMPAEFGCQAGEKLSIAIEIDSEPLPEGSVLERLLTLNSNGGQASVNTQFLVTWQPKLALDTKHVNFGELMEANLGQQIVSQFTVSNSGGGLLEGYVDCPSSWIFLGTSDFRLLSGQSLVVGLVADSGQLTLARSEMASISIQSTGGNITIPARISVMKTVYKQRTSRWVGYSILLLLGMLGWAVAAALSAWTLIGPVREQPILAAWLVGTLVVSCITIRIARARVSLLDEIELFYSSRDLASEIPVSQFEFRRLCLVAVALGLVGLLLGFNYQRFFHANWVLPLGAGIGLLLGALLAMSSNPWIQPGQVTGGSTQLRQGGKPQRFGRVRMLAISMAMAFLGMLVIKPWWIMRHGGGLRLTPAMVIPVGWWALVGLVIAAEAYPFLPLRLQWLLGKVRTSLVCILLGYLGWLAGTVIVQHTATPLVSMYAYLPSINLFLALRNLPVAALVIGGVALGIWADSTITVAGIPVAPRWQRVVTLLRALLPGLAVAVVGYILGGILFGVLGASETKGWAVLVTVLAAQAMAAWLVAARPQRGAQIWDWARRITSRAAGTVTARLSSIPWLTKPWTRLQSMLTRSRFGSQPVNLSPDLAIGVAGTVALLTPLAFHLLLSLLTVVGVFLVVAVLIGLFVWYRRIR